MSLRLGLIGDGPRTAFSVVTDRRIDSATHLLRCSISGAEDQRTVHVSIIDKRSQVNLLEWTGSYARDEWKFAPAALAGVVTRALRLPPAEVPIVSPAALEVYKEGLTATRRDSQMDEAVSLMERAVKLDDDSALTHAGLAEATRRKYFLTRDVKWQDIAIEEARKAEIRHPDCAEVHRILGLLEAGKGKLETAIARYQRSAELDASNADTYRRLGEIYQRTNQMNEALSAYKKAVEVEPAYYRAHWDLGVLYSRRANCADAIAAYRKAIELSPNEAGVRASLGIAYTFTGQFTEAEEQLRTALSLRETAADLHALGHVLMYRRRDAEALSYLDRALSIDRSRSSSWLYAGLCQRRLGREAKAQQAFSQGIRLAQSEVAKSPRSPILRPLLAYLFALTGERERAAMEIAQAIEISGKSEDLIWWAALTYDAVGRREEALQLLSDTRIDMLQDLNRWPSASPLTPDQRSKKLVALREGK